MTRPRTDGFFRRRWQGDVPVARLLWLDMMGVGTAVNVAATFVALMLAAQGASGALAVGVHLAPLPYNVFLFAAVLRAPGRTRPMLLAAALWLALMTAI